MTRAWTFLLCALFVAPASALAAGAAGAPNLPPQPSVRPAGMPAGYVMVSPCIPQMGEHWAKLGASGMPANPIYGTYHGKLVFSEIMVTTKQLQQGFNYADLAALPGSHIDHVSVDYEPHGHPGMLVPHYDIHAYYISPAKQAGICPNG